MMGNLAGWVSLVLCVHVLKADLITYLQLPLPEFVNSTCVIPFIYNEVTHYSCISVHSDYQWCSLDKKFQGRWRYCTRTDPPACTFPFSFRKRLFYRCTKKNYILNRSWCSLTKNYNKDGKWKQCSPYKQTALRNPNDF